MLSQHCLLFSLVSIVVLGNLLHSEVYGVLEASSQTGWQALYDATNGTGWMYCANHRQDPCNCNIPVSAGQRPNKQVVCNYVNGEFRIKQM
jgi:hypothetical protein